MAYTLKLTNQDWKAIRFSGHRYGWSQALLDSPLGPCDEDGNTELKEHEAWAIADAIESDTKGGHSPFPLLDPRSSLYQNLLDFCEAIV